MLFGKPEFFTKSHFENYKGYAPAYLCELVVYCLELLSCLSASGLKFRFKGGNSLLLILNKPERFSIDIDVASSEDKDKWTKTIQEIINQSDAFDRLEVRPHQTKPYLPMISYKVFFNSIYQPPENSYVMLDAVLKPAPYEGYITRIKAGNIYESDLSVEVSTPSGLIGDKLLTIGPSTLGIPIGKGKEAQRLKHIFDISRLSDRGVDPVKIKESFDSCIKQEMMIQEKNFTIKEILDDTLKFCEKPLKYSTPPDPEYVRGDPYLFEIVKGFEQFGKFLISADYSWDKLKADMVAIMKLLY